MIRSLYPSRTRNKSAGRAALGGVAGAAALTALSASEAQAQQGAAPLSVASVTPLPDGRFQITLSDGQVVTVPAEAVSLVDGNLVLSSELAAQLGLGNAALGGGTGVALGALGAVGGLGAVAVGSGGTGGTGPDAPASSAPVFTSGTAASFAENATGPVYTATATDADTTAPLVYGLAGPDAGLFNIDATTGVVTFMTPPDFETPGDAGGDNTYDIVVTASDGTHTTRQAVTVTVTDAVNDEAPVFTSGTAASFAENATGPVYTATATDADTTAPLVYGLAGADAGLFNIDATTGVVTFMTPPDFETPGDAGGDNTYDIVVTASDGTHTTRQAVTVTVTDAVNDEAPVFTSTPAARFIETATGPVYTATATDADTTAPLVYGLAGADAGRFNIDATTGVVTFAAPPDFEAPGDADGDNTYDISVTAFDGANTTQQAVTVRVTDATERVDLSGLLASEGFIIQGDEVADLAGKSVSSAGDVNGDGFDDLIVGAEGGDNGGDLAGEAYVIYGGPGPTNIDLTSLDVTQGIIIQGAQDWNVTGRSVSSAGDVNGDGFDDMIVGAPFANGNNGEAYVIYGGPGLTNIDLAHLSPAQGIVIRAVSGQAGTSVSSAGDMNGDGFDDVIVGAFQGDLGDPNAGEAYVIYGGTSLTNIYLGALTYAQGFFIVGDANNDWAGRSVSSAGDVNGDGFDDVIVGVPLGDGGGTDAGEAYVIYGGASLNDINLGIPLTPAQGFFILGDKPGDKAGWSVSSAGDVNGDGFDDVIVGAQFADGGASESGVAYVVYGGAALTGIDLGALTPAQGFTIRGDAADDEAGFSVSSAGDVNGDGFDDVIVGAPEGDDGGSKAGEAYVIYGGATLTDIDLATLTPAQGFIIQGDAPGDEAGSSVSAAGDVNGDGFDDLIVGALKGDDGGYNAGEAYVIYGGGTGTESTIAVSRAGTASADNFTGNAGNDSFTGIGTGDVVRGGAGNDTIAITGTDFAKVDGGRGTDVLSLSGSGLSLNLTGPRSDIEGFEIIDLTGSGDNALTLDVLSLLDLSDNTRGQITTFTVKGDPGDSVTATDFADWTAGAQQTIGGEVFDVYTSANVQLLIEEPVTFS